MNKNIIESKSGLGAVLGIVGMFLVSLPSPSAAQIVIEEELELSERSKSKSQAENPKKRIMAQATADPIAFEVQQDGPLKMIFEQGRRFKEAFAKKTSLLVSITNADGRVKYRRKVFPGDYFSEPVQGRLTPECSDLWHLYGEGSFMWRSGSTTETVDDANVFSLACDSDYAQSNGRCSTTNIGNGGGLQAVAWTYWGDPALTRAFVRFHGLEFAGPVQLEQARLSLFEMGGSWGSSQLSGSNAFTVSRVTTPWDEYGVSWNTQPAAGSPHLPGPAGVGDAQVDVTPIVQAWMNNPGSNHGFRLMLQNEQYYRNRSFISSERGSPPVLSVEVSNPQAQSDTLYVAYVNKGDQVSLEYESNGEAYASNTETLKTIGGEEVQGRQFIFNVTGPACSSQGFSERLQAFGWVDRSPLTLEIPEPKEAWPTIPERGARWEFFEYADIQNVLEDIEVSLHENGSPVGGHRVQVTAEWIYRSGGHYHEGSNDEEPISRSMGALVNAATGDSLQGRLVTSTDAGGKINLRYWTPQFGGKVALVASTTLNGKQLTARDTLTVAVPALQPLPDGTNYAKVGGTENHFGPRLDDEYLDSRTPDNNHYGTPAFVDSLVALADAWHTFVLQDSTQDSRQTPLNINDMSLPNGGKFDIYGRWSIRAENHAYHRVGRDADIRTTRSFPLAHPARNAVLLQETIINGVNTGYRNIDFEDMCMDKGANTIPKVHGSGGGEHYHVYFY